MEMPELNEDILEEGSNPDILNQEDDSANFVEPSLQNDNPTSSSDASLEKMKNVEENEKSQENIEEKNQTEAELSKPNETIVNVEKSNVGEVAIEKQDDEEPATKKLKLEELGKTLPPENEDDSNNQPPSMEPEPEPEADTESDFQSHAEIEPELSCEGAEPQQGDNRKSEISKAAVGKEEEGRLSAPDTDMLATLASAALDQDPKDKTSIEKDGSSPKSPVGKTESEPPKKKPEMWCNVGVFDTNTTIVSDYIAAPEQNEQVDLVTATLGGHRFQLEPGTAYKFRVCAVNGCGTGPWSDVAAFKTTLPGFPGAPSAIKISKSPEGAHLTWEPPGGNSSEILEYAVYLAVRSASQGCQPVTTNQAQLAFVRVFCGPTNKCMVGANSLQAAHIDTTTKPAIIFRIAARNSKGYGPATQVRWLQESQNGSSQGLKRTVKS